MFRSLSRYALVAAVAGACTSATTRRPARPPPAATFRADQPIDDRRVEVAFGDLVTLGREQYALVRWDSPTIEYAIAVESLVTDTELTPIGSADSIQHRGRFDVCQQTHTLFGGARGPLEQLVRPTIIPVGGHDVAFETILEPTLGGPQKTIRRVIRSTSESRRGVGPLLADAASLSAAITSFYTRPNGFAIVYTLTNRSEQAAALCRFDEIELDVDRAGVGYYGGAGGPRTESAITLICRQGPLQIIPPHRVAYRVALHCGVESSAGDTARARVSWSLFVSDIDPPSSHEFAVEATAE